MVEARGVEFSSDNVSGVHPAILSALSEANSGSAPSYGEDSWTARLTARISEIFEREAAVFPVITGGAANGLALSILTPPWGGVFCHVESHINSDECGGPEFLTHGAKLLPIAGNDAKVTAASLDEAAGSFVNRGVHSVQPACVSITQASERGCLYREAEICAISDVAKRRGLKLHMDGARFANALASSGATPAALSWKSGVDVLSFGATKNGAMAAEAVIVFDRAFARDLAFRRKRAGHLLSKQRFLSAQLLAYLDGGLWLALAARANAMAARLAQGLALLPSVRITNPTEANAVFAEMPISLAEALWREGAHFYPWDTPREGDLQTFRFVCSYLTDESEISALLRAAECIALNASR